MYLVEKPQPKAEDRPFNKDKYQYWPLPDTLERRPKAAPPRQIVEPGADLTGAPAFALRKEEFEQSLVWRKEELETHFANREVELKKAPPVRPGAVARTRILPPVAYRADHNLRRWCAREEELTTYIWRQMRLERRSASRSPKRRPRIHSRHWRRQRRLR
jgi:hypothetical protein